MLGHQRDSDGCFDQSKVLKLSRRQATMEPRKNDIRLLFAAAGKSANKRPSADDSTSPVRDRSKSSRIVLAPSLPFSQTAPDTASGEMAKSLVLDDEDETDEDEPSDLPPTMPTASSGRLSATSFSTQSGMPATSSQRIVKNGEVIVTNSDEDSASSSEMEDLDLMLGLSKSRPKPADLMPIVERASQESLGRRQQTTNWRSRGEIGLKRHFKVDTSIKSRRLLQDLAAKTNRERESAAAVAESIRSIHSANSRADEIQAQLDSAGVPGEIDPSTVAAMIGETTDREGIDRLIQAVRRTDALQSKQEYSFFGEQEPDLCAPMNIPDSLRKVFKTRQYTEAAMLDGFLDMLIASGNLQADEANLEWTLSMALTSERDGLHTAYCQLLLHADSEEWLNADWVWRMFFLMGASGDALDLTLPIKPRVRLGPNVNKPARNWIRVLRILKILETCAIRLPTQPRRDALLMLNRLALDKDMCLSHRTSTAVRQTLDTILETIPASQFDTDLSFLIDKIPQQTPDARFRVATLQALTSSSPRTLQLRHDLAKSYFFIDPPPSYNIDSPSHLSTLATYMQQQHAFQIRGDMDFASLAASIETLDALIDNTYRPSASTKDAREFNRGVDQLADCVKNMATQIRDSGANHLARTEAKEALDALHARLFFAVRTEPRPKKSVFGGPSALDGLGAMGSESFMRAFLERRGKKEAGGLE